MCAAANMRFVADVDHADISAFGDVRQLGHSRKP
jgi:hypothetical protein